MTFYFIYLVEINKRSSLDDKQDEEREKREVIINSESKTCGWLATGRSSKPLKWKKWNDKRRVESWL